MHQRQKQNREGQSGRTPTACADEQQRHGYQQQTPRAAQPEEHLLARNQSAHTPEEPRECDARPIGTDEKCSGQCRVLERFTPRRQTGVQWRDCGPNGGRDESCIEEKPKREGDESSGPNPATKQFPLLQGECIRLGIQSPPVMKRRQDEHHSEKSPEQDNGEQQSHDALVFTNILTPRAPKPSRHRDGSQAALRCCVSFVALVFFVLLELFVCASRLSCKSAARSTMLLGLRLVCGARTSLPGAETFSSINFIIASRYSSFHSSGFHLPLIESMSCSAMVISFLPGTLAGRFSSFGLANSSGKCINSNTSALPNGFTAARCSRVLITTLAMPTLPDFVKASRNSAYALSPPFSGARKYG